MAGGRGRGSGQAWVRAGPRDCGVGCVGHCPSLGGAVRSGLAFALASVFVFVFAFGLGLELRVALALVRLVKKRPSSA